MPRPKIYFRADGNSQIGLGHVIRSLALADMLSANFECHFIIRNPLPIIENIIAEICENIITLIESDNDLEEAKRITQTYLKGNEIIVLDGYNFKTEYQRIFKNKGCKLICIDDIHAYHFVADVVINHAPGLKRLNYSVEPYTRLCLGLDFALLRGPFLEAAKIKRRINEIKNLFICFGGSDFNNLTLKVLQALINNDLDFKEINVVLGTANQNKNEIRKLVQEAKNLKVNLKESLSAEQICEVMKKSDLAIVPSSSILYEIIAVNMPVISGYYVDNQINVHKGFRDLGLIYSIGNFNEFNDYKSILSEIKGMDLSAIIDLQYKNYSGKSKSNFLNIFSSLRGGV